MIELNTTKDMKFFGIKYNARSNRPAWDGVE
jgi:hypothetical protein